MKKYWKVTGNLLLKHRNETIANKFPDPIPLQGVKVKVSAREKYLSKKIWGPWNLWGEDRTNEKGFFRVTADKDKSERQFRIELLFKDETIKLYDDSDGLLEKIGETLSDKLGIGTDLTEDGLQTLFEQTSRLAFDVKWTAVLSKHQENKGDDDIDLGNIVIGPGDDRGSQVTQKHAITWFVFKKVFEVFDGFKRGLRFDNSQPVALKYPHNNPYISNSIEASYSDPYNYIIFIISNKQDDDFSIDTIVHELMHIWAYQHSTREKGMAYQLFIHGSTHDEIQNKSFVAFHEAFAEWASNRLIKQIFGKDSKIYGGVDDTGVPFSRKFLSDKGIKKYADVEFSEYGWISLFNMLTIPDLHHYDFNSSDTYAAYSKVVRLVNRQCSSPALSFEDVLKIFTAHENKGYKDMLDKKEMNIDDFLRRAARISDKLTTEHIIAIKKLLDPEETISAIDVICPITKQNTRISEWQPNKQLQEVPIKK